MNQDKYESGTCSRVMRIRRVQEHGSAPLQAAVEAGLITVYRGGEIAKLPVDEQALAVAQWINRSLCRTEAHAIAAAVLRKELTRSDSKIDLDRVLSAIRTAVLSAQIIPNGDSIVHATAPTFPPLE